MTSLPSKPRIQSSPRSPLIWSSELVPLSHWSGPSVPLMVAIAVSRYCAPPSCPPRAPEKVPPGAVRVFQGPHRTSVQSVNESATPGSVLHPFSGRTVGGMRGFANPLRDPTIRFANAQARICANVKERKAAMPHRQLSKAIELIESEPARAWTIGALARSCGIGPRALQKQFRRLVGCTPLEHLRTVRLNRVRQELL